MQPEREPWSEVHEGVFGNGKRALIAAAEAFLLDGDRRVHVCSPLWRHVPGYAFHGASNDATWPKSFLERLLEACAVPLPPMLLTYDEVAPFTEREFEYLQKRTPTLALIVPGCEMKCPVDGSMCHDLDCQRSGCQG